MVFYISSKNKEQSLMGKIRIEFSADLVRFVKKRGYESNIVFQLKKKSPLKEIIECHGIPHTEVGEILLKNNSVGFGYFPKNGDSFFIKGISSPIDIFSSNKLRKDIFDEVKFIADVNVGKAAVLLRALGFDTIWQDGISDRELAEIAYDEERIVITRDIDLLKRKKVVFGQFVDAKNPFLQTRLILERFGLKGPFDLFSRCTRCNSPLKEISKEDIKERLLPKTKKYYDKFYICENCNKIYWEGSHREKIINDFKSVGVNID